MDYLLRCIPVSLVFISNFSRIHPRSCHQLEQYSAGNLFPSLSVVFFPNGLDCLRKRAGNMSRLSDTALVFHYSIAMFSGGSSNSGVNNRTIVGRQRQNPFWWLPCQQSCSYLRSFPVPLVYIPTFLPLYFKKNSSWKFQKLEGATYKVLHYKLLDSQSV